jgi:hypothetical protein
MLYVEQATLHLGVAFGVALQAATRVRGQASLVDKDLSHRTGEF